MNFAEQKRELEAKRAALKTQVADLHTRAADRSFDDGETERFANLTRGIDKIDDQILALRSAQIADLQEGAASGRYITAPGSQTDDGYGSSFNVNRSAASPWDDSEASRFGDDRETSMRYRAEAVIERQDWSGLRVDVDSSKERVAQLIAQATRSEDPRVHEYLVAVSDPNYRRAFHTIIRNPTTWQALLTEPERAAFARTRQGHTGTMVLDTLERTAMSLTNGNGGYALPFLLDPSIVLQNDGSIDPLRQISRVVTGGQNVWHGVSSAGVTAEWLAEAAEVADGSPTVGPLTITAYKGAAYIQASFEFWEDGNIESEIGMLVADAKANIEATAHIVGNGTTQPQGVVTGLGLVTASRLAGSSTANGGTLVVADLYAMDNQLASRYWPGASWLSHRATLNSIRRFGEGSTGNASFWVDLGGGIPSSLIGHSTYATSAMDSTVVSGSTDDVLVLGDFRQGYTIYDRLGVTLAFEPLVKGASRRPTGEVAWFAHWRTGAAVTNAAAFVMLRL